MRRITLRLMPFLFVLYFVAFLDRVNVSFAGLRMTKELGMTPADFGFAAGIFFLGYFLLEIPGAILAEAWSARKWIARIMITWGFLAAGTGLINDKTQLYWLRFLLGLAEAGFFPGMIVYLSHWYPARQRAKAVATFMIAIPVSEIVGAPLSAMLMKLDWFGLAGWRWLLILEGLPAVVLGIVTLYYLTDWPREAKWLAPDERDWISNEIDRERREHPQSHSVNNIWEAFRNKQIFLLMFAYFTFTNLTYGLMMWLPKIMEQTFAASHIRSTMLTAIPFMIGAPAALMIGWHSDRVGERRWHCAAPLLAGAAALSLFPLALGNVAACVILFAFAVMGNQSAKGPFWAIATTVLSGKAAATSVGMINSFGNLGGFAGPYAIGWLATHTQGFEAGVLYLSCAMLAGAMLILVAARKARRAPAAAPQTASA